jgi:chemotaxis protein methyltransferase CheR
MKRIRHYNLESFDDYYNKVISSPSELQIMVDTLTTNETSFFREPQHFEFMKREILPKFHDSKIRVWSAAASIGAEAYSIAMVLDDLCISRHIVWEVIGTDISTDVIQRAKNALYPIDYAKPINTQYLKKYCLKGVNSQENFFIIDDYLKHNVKFLNANLMNPAPPNIGQFDIIFLRNMLIYFDNKNKGIIVENVVKALKPRGYLFIGHSESLNHITNVVKQIRPTIYIKD